MKILGSNDDVGSGDSPPHQGGPGSSSGAMSAPVTSSGATSQFSVSSTPAASGSAHGTSKTNIREKLLKFFLRRPTMEDLFRKGIIKNEPVFGSTLRELQVNAISTVA